MKKILILVAIIAVSSLTGIATLQYANRLNSDEVRTLEGRIEQLESELTVERSYSIAATKIATEGVPPGEYEKVVSQYNELVTKYNALVGSQSYAPTYSPVYCTSHSYSYSNTTYTNCY